MAIVISTVNIKGGVGKTTLTVNLAASLAHDFHFRVLLVDLDPQVNATVSVIAPAIWRSLHDQTLTLHTMLQHALEEKPGSHFQEVIQRNVCGIEGLDLLPGDLEFYDEYELFGHLLQQQTQGTNVERSIQVFRQDYEYYQAFLIHQMLIPVQDHYDYILLDCPSSFNLLTRSGLAASDYYLLPVRADPLSVLSIRLILNRINKLTQTLKQAPQQVELLGVVFNMLQQQSRYPMMVLKEVRKDCGRENVFPQWIPADLAVARAVQQHQPVVISEPDSLGAQAFKLFAEGFLDRIDKLRPFKYVKSAFYPPKSSPTDLPLYQSFKDAFDDL
ncbi:MAG: ParA family protein [Gloeobacterales cyanobacterium]